MHEVLSVAQMSQADAFAAEAGTPGRVLMEKAGRAVADKACEISGGGRVVVLCGPGNNGGDGYVAARLLAGRGLAVTLLANGAPRGDASLAASSWEGPVAGVKGLDLSAASLVVDALLGAGLDRPLDRAMRALVEAVAASGVPVLAVDMPSGIHGDTGAVMGAALDAVATVTFVRRKPGHLLLPGRLKCGAVEVADIGIDEGIVAAVGADTFRAQPALWRGRFPKPAPDGHKYRRGHAVVVSGPAHRTGAARLAARGALRIGAGLVTIASPLDAVAANAAHLTAIMLAPFDGAEGLEDLLADDRLNAVAIGPGCGRGEATRALVAAALEGERAVVLDADALTSFDHAPAELFAMIGAVRGRPVVLTPHEGEYARLLRPESALDDGASKLVRARSAARRSGAVIVLKGPDTVVAAPDGRAAIADNAPPWLATAGAGDVLAGFVTGLFAQGMPAFEAAVAAVWLHGEAASAFGPGLIAEDLPESLPGILATHMSAGSF